jgi:hypothetical protein
MLTIRKEQMAVLEAYMMRKYVDRVVQKIARTFPGKYKQEGQERTRLMVQAGIEKAAGYSITEDDEVERFVLVLAEYGMEFERAPERIECQQILEDKELPGDAKVSLVCRQLKAAGASSPPSQPRT